MTCEVNFDGLVGPTHYYAGLSYGNLASAEHKGTASSPRRAALEGLAKMKKLAELGLHQAVLPPQERPDMQWLRRLGFYGTDHQVLCCAGREAPKWLAACSSASSMWAANAATVCPSADAPDGRVHFTPANLAGELHRCIEPPTTAAVLKYIFADNELFVHHEPLPATTQLGDEGAANHTRLCRVYGEPGIQMFVYGAKFTDPSGPSPKRYPVRQSYEASAAIARLHGLSPSRTIFVQQHPDAVDTGVFHNDVIAVGNLNVLFYHAEAFVDANAVIDKLRREFERSCGSQLHTIKVVPEQICLARAVATYLFNSQLVRLPDRTSALVCPEECRRDDQIRDYLQTLVTLGSGIDSVHYVDVRQSMKNGGGPACLRLRVVLNATELARSHQGVMLSDSLYDKLVSWVHHHYRDHLHCNDLVDPNLLEESRTALDELTRILDLGTMYSFQRG